MTDLTAEEIAELDRRLDDDCYAQPWSVRDRWLQNPEVSIAHFGSPVVALAIADLYNAAPQLLAMAARTAEVERILELEEELGNDDRPLEVKLREAVEQRDAWCKQSNLHSEAHAYACYRIVELERQLGETKELLDSILRICIYIPQTFPAIVRWRKRRAALDAATPKEK